MAARGRARRVRRPLVVAGLLTLGGLLLWSTAWGTGLPTSTGLAFADDFPISALRYMLPAIGAATVTVAVATRARAPLAALATGVLALALAWNLVASARLGSPWTPPVWIPLLGAAAGLAALLLVSLATRRRRTAWRLPPLAGWSSVVAAVAVGAILAPFGSGIVDRYTRVEGSTAYGPELVQLVPRPTGLRGHRWPDRVRIPRRHRPAGRR